MDIIYSPWRTRFKFASRAELDGTMQVVLEGEDYYQKDVSGLVGTNSIFGICPLPIDISSWNSCVATPTPPTPQTP
jgi:hypothetical protein